MAIIKYIDGANLAYAFNKIKALISTKANADLSNVGEETLASAVEKAGVKNYTHPTTSGNKHIPAGGASGQILKWSADGTAHWADEASVTVDSALSSSSTNPVQNKVVKEALDGKLPKAGGTMTGNLKISKSNSPEIEMVVSGDNGYTSMYQHGGTLNISSGLSDGGDDSFAVLTNPGSDLSNLFRIGTTIGGVVKRYKLYGEHNKPTANDLGAVPTGGVDTDFSEYTTWADLLSALPVGSVTMVRIAEINDALVPADCPDTAWASFVIRKPNTVYQTCSVTLHAYTENGPRIFEGIFAQGTAEVGWMEVAAVGHTQAASTITAGTFAATGVKAAIGTDYGTARIRNIQASTTDLTAGSSDLANGEIYLVYE